MSHQARLAALHILTALIDNQTPLSHSMKVQPNLLPLSKALCFGVSRHYIRLTIIAESLMAKRPKQTTIWVVILMGLYQLQFMDKPQYATVQETVSLLPKIKCAWAKGLVNAILRRFCREQADIIEKLSTTPDYQTNHPQWLVEQFKQSWPNHYLNMLAANDQHPPMTLRVNHQKNTTASYIELLAQHKIDANKSDNIDTALRLTKPVSIHDLPGFSQGLVSVQDESAQLATPLLSLKPGLRVLDACCAPGGKTCHQLESEPNLLECIAVDIEAQRLTKVQENLDRLHLTATLINGDGCQPDQWWDGKPFDRILLDAPCSATGVIRRQPDIKLIRTAQDIKSICQVQFKLLRALWPLLAPGGVMVYATCSVLPEENELQIARFVADTNDCEIIKESHDWGAWQGHGWQILPCPERDGFFYSKLKKITYANQ